MLREDDGIAVGSEGANSRGRTHCRFCDASLEPRHLRWRVARAAKAEPFSGFWCLGSRLLWDACGFS